ncbi:MAG: PD40 domain-containing protein [Saprospiraceae bacterium]|nr:PD40 domain-containing protein [Saprospiraceae bacterium]
MKKFIVFLLGFTLFAPFAELFSQTSDLKAADKHFQLKNYTYAMKAYEAILTSEPANTKVLPNLALCYKNTQKSDLAKRTFSRFIDQTTTDPELLFEYADFLRNQGEHEHAKKYYLKYSKHNPLVGNYFAQSCDYAIIQLKQASNCKLSNLESNTKDADYAPVSIGEDILFASNQVNTTGIKAGHTEFFKRSAESKTNRISLSALQEVLKKEASGLGNISYAQNGTLVAFSKSKADKQSNLIKDINALEIYFAEVDHTGSWKNIHSFPYNHLPASFGFPNLADDGKTLYFASNEAGGFGGYDLYVSYLNQDKSWSQPQNMGAVINTPGNEIAPSLNGNNLFFSSDWHIGYGGFDVFKTKKQGLVWQDIQNMGSCVNSTMDEYYFIMDIKGDAYFASNRFGGKGAEDIYQSFKLKLPKDAKNAHLIDTEIGDIALTNRANSISENSNANEKIMIFDDPAISGKQEAQANKLYFIQITALSKYSEKIIDRFSKYSVYGDVYRVEADGVSKIRIGAFTEVNEAIAVLNILKKNGLKDAFIVADIIESSRTTMLIKSTINIPKAESNNETTPQNQTANETGKYKIRVSEYKAPDWFDVSKISDLGSIEHWTKGGWTIIVLGNFNTENAAKDIILKLKARGFKESYIVVEENGKLYRL